MALKKKAVSFGAAFTPHMLLQNYRNGKWSPARITAFQPLALSPSTVVFHYAQEIFEGFKAYRQLDGSVCLFRPERNLARMNASAARLCMPPLDAKATLSAIVKLLKKDKARIPDPPCTLYIRPCMIATDTTIGVHPSHDYTFFVIVCVVDAYFAGQHPLGVRLRTETEFVRAARGGTGACKCGGNYAASLAAQAQAERDGFDQVVWLDGCDRKYVEEMGGMNIMFVLDGTLVTPPLSGGTILPGVTRESLLQLAQSLGRTVEERPVSVEELKLAYQAGRLHEAFACGTAAVVTPIRELVHKGEVIYRNTGSEPGLLTRQLRTQLMDIQFGRAPDPFGWRYPVKLYSVSY